MTKYWGKSWVMQITLVSSPKKYRVIQCVSHLRANSTQFEELNKLRWDKSSVIIKNMNA